MVAGVCQEIGLADYLDQRAGETNHHVSVGTATTAMILNGLGFSNRRLYLAPQFFASILRTGNAGLARSQDESQRLVV